MATPRCPGCKERARLSGRYQTFERGGEQVELEVCWMCAVETDAAECGEPPAYTMVVAA